MITWETENCSWPFNVQLIQVLYHFLAKGLLICMYIDVLQVNNRHFHFTLQQLCEFGNLFIIYSYYFQ